ncbi:MAG: 4Fe-4S double cluster binding domain-containing protein [Elusimicrobiales bacterium]
MGIAGGLKAEIKGIALDCGATSAGIASAEPLSAEIPRIAGYVRSGLPPGMEYIARPPRLHADIREWFPPAKSALICAFGYGGLLPELRLEMPPAELDARMKLRGHALDSHFFKYKTVKAAAFSVLDYHAAVKAALRKMLARAREKYPGLEGKIFCDTSPVLEKALAARAGLGWIGRNTLLLTPECGSFLVLGGIALSAELEPDSAPGYSGCGDCKACLAACSNGALSDYRLNPALCSSWRNIPRKTPLSEKDALLCGDRADGCDICQRVCPRNHSATARSAIFKPRS